MPGRCVLPARSDGGHWGVSPVPGARAARGSDSMNGLLSVLFSFDGRINRAKFWGAEILVTIVAVVVMLIAQAGGNGGGVIILVILVPLMIWTGLAVGVKRFHDRDKSGAWVLIQFVPIIGGLWYLIECGFLEGTSGPNQYGPDPLNA